MKAPLCARAAAAVLMALLAAGCESMRDARIKEHAALYASLDPFSQKLVRQGLFDYGFTPEVLYMSLGKPNRVSVAETEKGRIETWTYRNFLYESANAVTVGVNTPGMRPLGSVISSSAPGGPSLNSTKAGPGNASVAEDTALCTLLIDLLDDKVVAVRIQR